MSKAEAENLKDKDAFWLQRRYRLMWHDVKYEPGELRVVAYHADGSKAGEQVVRTAGKPYALKLTMNNEQLTMNSAAVKGKRTLRVGNQQYAVAASQNF